MLPIEKKTAAIDPAAVVACPMKDFAARRAYLSCPDCELFNGLAIMSTAPLAADNPTAGVKWSDKYAIRCAHVIERRTQNLEVIEG